MKGLCSKLKTKWDHKLSIEKNKSPLNGFINHYKKVEIYFIFYRSGKYSIYIKEKNKRY